MPEEKLTETYIPVYIPTMQGNEVKVEVGHALLEKDTATIHFTRDDIFAGAVQRMLQRGVVLGLSFVMVDLDEENNKQTEGEN